MDQFPPDEIAYQTAHINDDLSPVIMGLGTTFTAIASLLFITRIVARRVTRVKLGLYDYLSFAGLVSYGL